MPLPLERLFTYRITQAESSFLKRGMRVAVPFGKSKIYTAIVFKIHQEEPLGYEAKEIFQILDETPVVNEYQLKLWSWIAKYYTCSLGDVLRAGLPSLFLLESETLVIKNEKFVNEEFLNNEEFKIFKVLQDRPILKIDHVIEILGKKKVLPIVNELIAKEAVTVKEEIFERYKPKLIKYVRVNKKYRKDSSLEELLNTLSRAKKQKELLMHYFTLDIETKKPIKAKELLARSGISSSILKTLVEKEILELYYIQKDRVTYGKAKGKTKELNEYQQKALQEIKGTFAAKPITLLHGITSSGKTEIYVKLIEEIIQQGKQVLYLLPEIALTTQLIERLKLYFGNSIAVFHSKYSLQERVEVWHNVLHKKQSAQIILGARSSVFLPFSDLGLVIVDEEHETSYKQFDPSPRYHARDTAIVLAQFFNAKVLLGSATPSLESYYNAQKGKYGLVGLHRRHGNVLLPEIELVSLKEKYRKKKMQGHFSDRMITLMQNALEEKEQIIIFQNRRGYAPIVTCTTCGVSPQCPNCDVSLTYHKYKDELRCHYCNHTKIMYKNCMACGGVSLTTKGFGTEQIELEIKELFPMAKVARMDLDTTKGKYDYYKIIHAFESREIDILVGTQMLSKGLDFENVSLVGILNADNMLNFPDFRAHERSFQLMVQVSGRAGRAKKRGSVVIQSYNPFHQILQQVTTNDYEGMFKEQLEERYQYKYPPLLRTLKIVLKHKDFNKVNNGAEWLARSLRNQFGENVLGPSSPLIARVRNQFIKNILIKLPERSKIEHSKSVIRKIKLSFQSIAEFRPIRFVIDVDNY